MGFAGRKISSIFDAHVVKNDFYGCSAKGKNK